MSDKAAHALKAQLRTQPKDAAFNYRRAFLAKGVSELQPGERADVSWITEESVDRAQEVVLASGMDDSHFRLNPIVTLNHCYHAPPAGKSVWRKRVREGQFVGIKAKTRYPERPAGWPETDWLPDKVFGLIQADLLRGKSIGFLPLKDHTPKPDEIRQKPEWANAEFIIDEWLLLEYACCFLPCQQNAVVEAVSKGLVPADVRDILGLQAVAPVPAGRPVSFTPYAEIQKAIAYEVGRLDFPALAEKALKEGWDKLRGRV